MDVLQPVGDQRHQHHHAERTSLNDPIVWLERLGVGTVDAKVLGM